MITSNALRSETLRGNTRGGQRPKIATWFSIFLAALISAVFLSTPAFSDETSEDAFADMTVGQLARHYRVYQRDMDMLEDLSFTDVRELRGANDLIMSYEPPELTRGWYAHNALVAARSPGFMAAMRDRAQASGAERFFSQADANPLYIWNLSSQTAALNRVLNGVRNDHEEASAVGDVLSERAYAYMDRRYGSRLPDGSSENAVALRAARAAESEDTGRIFMPYRAQTVMMRVLDIAARLTVDHGGNRTSASGLIYPQRETDRCLRWAQLNLAQCLAAARSPAEEAFCTGRHGIEEVSSCWSWMVEAPASLEISQAE